MSEQQLSDRERMACSYRPYRGISNTIANTKRHIVNDLDAIS